ncbi:hypothetical protein CAMRE0001_0370 [Campylobacter rectus RM3267]|uniref:Uncharacterized protein n=1 Tax=Campylobacter rectus RM3267 TaxID=553218 RepID=B9D2E0_CAMRE|nr:hypothetical protein CAMRE0001_0370 [Campylobacter rectus RM3267]
MLNLSIKFIDSALPNKFRVESWMLNLIVCLWRFLSLL